jgi:glycosyltransferase involved in cell wall biosynthesis
MRIVICWDAVTGYLGACWRALARRKGVDLLVLASPWPRGGGQDSARLSRELLRGIHGHLLGDAEKEDAGRIASLVLGHNPEAVLIGGWFQAGYRKLAFNPALSRARLILAMDNPRRDSWRQRLAPLRIGSFLRRMDRVLVAGERSWQLARYWNVPEEKIRRGMYGVDYAGLSPLYERRRSDPEGWPRRFLFAGRYEQVKGIDTLLEGYRLYRESVRDPWPLTCCGAGSLAKALGAAAGVTDLGFVPPAGLAEVWRRHGVFVLASHFDPWPLVVVEACAAGMPVLCTQACGSAVEMIRPYYNGLIPATGNVRAWAAGMRWMHENHARLPALGARGRQMAEAYSAESWSDRILGMLSEFGCPPTTGEGAGGEACVGTGEGGRKA